MPGIIEMPKDENSVPGIDISKRYDLYCRAEYPKETVYRNVLIKGKKTLLKTGQFSPFSEFLEIEQANG
jgi:hypothetical protein